MRCVNQAELRHAAWHALQATWIGKPSWSATATSQSALHLTDGVPIAGQSRYAKLRVSAAGSASVLVMQSKPGDLSPLSIMEYRCPLATDAKPAGVSLYGL